MAYRRALASGLQRLARHVAKTEGAIFNAGESSLASIGHHPTSGATSKPFALETARWFAAQPAAAPAATNVGKITQVREANPKRDEGHDAVFD